jgi:putative (di)nucleoside polyphosphate hydrolase
MASNLRDNVAAIIINKDKKVLMCEHIWIDDAWQLPQGGVENGESVEEALIRELEEEIGTKNLKIVDKMQEKLTYKFPYYLKNKYDFDGNEQTYFLLYFYGNDKEIRFDNQEKPEFKSFEWVEYSEPPLRVIYFKKIAYLKALEHFKETVEKFDPKKFEKENKLK